MPATPIAQALHVQQPNPSRERCVHMKTFSHGSTRKDTDDKDRMGEQGPGVQGLATKSAKNAQSCRHGKNRSESESSIRIHPLSFGYGRTSVRLPPGRIIRFRSHTSAYIRLHPLSFAYDFLFMHEAESGRTPAFAKAMAGRGKFLPGGDESRRAPECVTANSPECVTLAGLKHRDSPEYVTKKIMSDRINGMGSELTTKEDMRSAGRRPLHARRMRSPEREGRMNQRKWLISRISRRIKSSWEGEGGREVLGGKEGFALCRGRRMVEYGHEFQRYF